MGDQASFNINAELYENKFGDLAIKFAGEKVYRDVGPNGDSTFVKDAKAMLERGEHPGEWHEMPAHELLYGQDWHCIVRMGYINGDLNKPGVEMEVDPEKMGQKARAYLKDALP